MHLGGKKKITFAKELAQLSFLFTFSIPPWRKSLRVYEIKVIVRAFNLNWLILLFLLQVGSIYLCLRT